LLNNSLKLQVKIPNYNYASVLKNAKITLTLNCPCMLQRYVGYSRDVAQSSCAYFRVHRPKFHLARHVTSRHHSTRSTCRASRDERVERVESCCSTSSTQAKCMGSTRRTCRVVSWRDVTSQPSGIWAIVSVGQSDNDNGQ